MHNLDRLLKLRMKCKICYKIFPQILVFCQFLIVTLYHPLQPNDSNFGKIVITIGIHRYIKVNPQYELEVFQ